MRTRLLATSLSRLGVIMATELKLFSDSRAPTLGRKSSAIMSNTFFLSVGSWPKEEIILRANKILKIISESRGVRRKVYCTEKSDNLTELLS